LEINEERLLNTIIEIGEIGRINHSGLIIDNETKLKF